MDESQVQDLIDKSLATAQYSVPKVPFHVHNSTDSPRVDFADIAWNTFGYGNLGQVITSQGTSATPAWGAGSAGRAYFGNGSDGTITVSATTATLTSDKFYDTLTVGTSGVIITNGYRIFAKTKITNSGNIKQTGNNGGNGGAGGDATGVGATGSGGTSGATGATLTSGTLYGAVAGVAGAVGGGFAAVGNDGHNGVVANPSCFSVAAKNGGAGGAGGTVGGPNFAGGSGGSGATPIYYTGMQSVVIATNPYIANNFIQGAASGGSGAGGGGGAHQASNNASAGGGGGGGSGSPGGIIALYSPIIDNSAGTISVVGGNGGNGGTGGTATINSNLNGAEAGGGGGGGASGDGGVVILVYSTSLSQGTINISAGTPGARGNGGTASNPGSGGASQGSPGVAGTSGSTGATFIIQV